MCISNFQCTHFRFEFFIRNFDKMMYSLWRLYPLNLMTILICLALKMNHMEGNFRNMVMELEEPNHVRTDDQGWQNFVNIRTSNHSGFNLRLQKHTFKQYNMCIYVVNTNNVLLKIELMLYINITRTIAIPITLYIYYNYKVKPQFNYLKLCQTFVFPILPLRSLFSLKNMLVRWYEH